VTDLRQLVAETADAVGDHATAPALLMDLQVQLGRLTGLSQDATERGRRPFRVPPGWDVQLGELAYVLYLLADQTGVDVEQQLAGTAWAHRQRAAAARNSVGQPAAWPFES
jgi:hypothetical protein